MHIGFESGKPGLRTRVSWFFNQAWTRVKPWFYQALGARVNNKILDHFQEAHEQDDGKQTVLIFRNGLQNIVKEALQERDFSDDTAVLAKAAKIERRDMFSHKGLSFSGTFPLGCQEISLPASLKSLIMIMNGLNVKDQENKESQACLTVCQTVLF